jgi:hypothetical protein
MDLIVFLREKNLQSAWKAVKLGGRHQDSESQRHPGQRGDFHAGEMRKNQQRVNITSTAWNM